MTYFSRVKAQLQEYLSKSAIEKVYQAYLLGEQAHQGQMRSTGEPYITHPVAVVGILAHMRMDAETLIAAILHDVLEDTDTDKATIVKRFGKNVAELVDGVSKLTQMKFETRAQAQAENFRKMVLAMAKDIRVIIIKLADRLHNMRTLDAVPLHKQQRTARETLEIYAPIANRLGMHTFRLELEDLGLRFLYPTRYRILSEAVKRSKSSRRKVIKVIEKAINSALTRSQVPFEKILGREKRVYSIYRKMRSKRLPFSQIMDIYGFRIIVKDIDACYRALGAVHNLYKPVPERFKDYIAIPKANGYQSLHTTLFGPYGDPIEIQIRSIEMEHIAESGIAAHWLYKSARETASETQIRARQWLKGLLDLQQKAGTSIEFIENVKIDLFPEEVYVFSPKGAIFELPAGSTVIDFAYAVHSDIGNTCVAAKINRKLAPLSSTLSNGQTVEVITSAHAGPNPVWLNFAVTGKAKSTIRNYLKRLRSKEAIALGKHLLSNALPVALRKIPKRKIAALLESYQYKHIEDLYESIGLGNQIALVVAQRLIGKTTFPETLDTQQKHPLVIKGSEGMVISYAECCRPIPGDPIMGVLQENKGIVVHVEQCKNIEKIRMHSEKCVPLRWEDHIERRFDVDLQITLTNKPGALAALTSAIANADANIDNISLSRREGFYYLIYLTISVFDRAHLARVMRLARNTKMVVKIVRQKS
jgi:guanosine-3',5'-bis(diphosphate) 3'-pyrophosphohydrolase